MHFHRRGCWNILLVRKYKIEVVYVLAYGLTKCYAINNETEPHNNKKIFISIQMTIYYSAPYTEVTTTAYVAFILKVHYKQCATASFSCVYREQCATASFSCDYS